MYISYVPYTVKPNRSINMLYLYIGLQHHSAKNLAVNKKNSARSQKPIFEKYLLGIPVLLCWRIFLLVHWGPRLFD